jgi:hypothetical protein
MKVWKLDGKNLLQDYSQVSDASAAYLNPMDNPLNVSKNWGQVDCNLPEKPQKIHWQQLGWMDYSQLTIMVSVLKWTQT